MKDLTLLKKYYKNVMKNVLQHAFYSFVPPNTCGRISITIVEAKLAKNYGLVRMDPYCRIRIGNTVFETPTSISGGKSPKWNRIVNAYLPYGVESVYLQVFDEVIIIMSIPFPLLKP